MVVLTILDSVQGLIYLCIHVYVLFHIFVSMDASFRFIIAFEGVLHDFHTSKSVHSC